MQDETMDLMNVRNSKCFNFLYVNWHGQKLLSVQQHMIYDFFHVQFIEEVVCCSLSVERDHELHCLCCLKRHLYYAEFLF